MTTGYVEVFAPAKRIQFPRRRSAEEMRIAWRGPPLWST
jgi:hypothetical protein